MEAAFSLPPRLLASAPAAPNASGKSEAELRKVAQEFEAMMLSQMLAPMFAGLTTDGLGGGGQGEEMFRPMLIEEYSKAMASRGGIGLAEPILRELLRLQTLEANPDGAPR